MNFMKYSLETDHNFLKHFQIWNYFLNSVYKYLVDWLVVAHFECLRNELHFLALGTLI